MTKILILAAYAAIVCFINPTMAKDDKEELTPKFIVQDILSKGKSGTYASMTNDRIKEMKHYLSTELKEALTEWVRTKDKFKSLGPSPDGRYDPLLSRRWNPEEIMIVSEEITGDKAIVVVRETLESGKIYTGYSGINKYLFTKHGGNWMLDNITISRELENGRFAKEDVMSNLAVESKEFLRLYDSEIAFRKKKEK
jgi:hypothetical protein